MKAAGPHLQALIIAAIETGARRNELLSLQLSNVSVDAPDRWLSLTTGWQRRYAADISPVLRAAPPPRRHSTRSRF